LTTSLRQFSHVYIYSETVGGARERNLRENSKEVSSLTERCFNTGITFGEIMLNMSLMQKREIINKTLNNNGLVTFFPSTWM